MVIELSFIVPAHNVGPYITDCLNSIVRATDIPCEVIVVDDRSTDDTIPIAQKIAAENPTFRFTFLATQDSELHRQGGPAAARNLGLENASGRFVAFIDSDDWINAQAYVNLVHLVDRNECDFGWLKAIVFNETKGEFRHFNDRWIYDRILAGNRYVVTDAKENTALLYFEASNCNRVYRRDFFLQHVAPFPDGLLYEDLPTHFRALSSATNIVITDLTGYYYRTCRPNKRTDRNDDARFDIAAILDIIANELNNWKFKDEAGANMLAWLVDFCYWCIESLPWSRRGQLIQKLTPIFAKFPDTWIRRVIAESWGDDRKSYKLWLLLKGNIEGIQMLTSSRFNRATSFQFYRETRRTRHIKHAVRRHLKNIVRKVTRIKSQ
ncbi:glycosyltransferase [Burkholderia multivorans]|nr:glycosyltransferase [Burkholderia multivorans]